MHRALFGDDLHALAAKQQITIDFFNLRPSIAILQRSTADAGSNQERAILAVVERKIPQVAFKLKLHIVRGACEKRRFQPFACATPGGQRQILHHALGFSAREVSDEIHDARLTRHTLIAALQIARKIGIGIDDIGQPQIKTLIRTFVRASPVGLPRDRIELQRRLE